MAIETQRFPDEGIELPGEEVGQVERGDLVLCSCEERSGAFEKRVAMGPRDHLNPKRVANGLEPTSGATIGVNHKDLCEPVPMLGHRGFYGFCDLIRMVVEDRRQAGQRDMRPIVKADQGQDLARQCATGNKQDGRRLRGLVTKTFMGEAFI